MNPISVRLDLDEFIFDVEVTHLINQSPDPTCRDSADDFRGIREMEWHLTYAVEHDDNGKRIAYGQLPWWLAKLTRDHFELIDAKLWQMIDQKKERQL